MALIIPLDIKLIQDIIIQEECDFSQGHCFGSDGGSGIPDNLKVPIGRGGNQEVWTLNLQQTKILAQQYYSRCQYCLKYYYAGEKTEEIKEE